MESMRGLIVGVFCLTVVWSIHTENVQISTDHVVNYIDDMFVGFTIDTITFRDAQHQLNLSQSTLVNLTKELTPSFLRVGGTACDYVTFDPNSPGTHGQPGNQTFTLNGEHWDMLNQFVKDTDTQLIYCLNVLQREHGKWDPTNSKQLLDYSSRKGYKIAGFELGNEPNTFTRRGSPYVSAEMLAKDFHTLKTVLQNSAYNTSKILGPDTTSHAYGFMKDFLSSGGIDAVDIVTCHHYYMKGSDAKPGQFTNATTVLDQLKKRLLDQMTSIRHYKAAAPVWLGETAAVSGGGVPNMTGRYVGGILWLDKLGLSARYGVKGVMRQSLMGRDGGNALLQHHYLPTPDYWVTLLYKRLVGYEVFDVKTSTNTIRVYAHCTKTKLKSSYNYDDGSLSIYAINTNLHPVILKFPTISGRYHLDVYWLTPPDGDIHSQSIQIKGKTLSFGANHQMPDITPKTVTSGSVTVPGTSYGFIVVSNANVDACKKTYAPILG